MTNAQANESRPNVSPDGIATLPMVASSVSATRPFAEAAWGYKKAGHAGPIPIGFATKGSPAGPRKKLAPPTGYTGWAGRDPSGPDIQAWIDAYGHFNMGLRIPKGFYVLDFDKAGLKEELEQKAGVKFPPTWTNTSKGEGSPFHHAFYRAELPEGRMWRDHPLKGMDSLHEGHRYAVVWPSVHPDGSTYYWYDTEGELYEGAPSPDEFAVLPPELAAICSHEGTPLEGSAAGSQETRAALDSFRRDPACPRVTKLLGDELARMEAGKASGSIREPGKLHELTCLGIEGHAGVVEALTVHQETYVKAREEARGERADTASADWWRQVRGTVGKKLLETQGEITPMCDCSAGTDEEWEKEVTAPGPGVTGEIPRKLTLKERLLTPAQLRDRPSVPPLIKGVLDMDSATWLIGAPGGFKSFLALDWACHVAAGKTWNETHKVIQGDVVYVVAEGVRGFSKRVQAWSQHHKIEPERLHILPVAVQARGDEPGKLSAGWRELAELVAEMKPSLVVLDTQARLTAGMEENSNTEMGVWVRAVDILKRASGGCVLVVHHTGRNGGDARGASAIDGAQDAEWRVDRKAHELACVVSMDKNKDGDDSKKWGFRMEVVTVGKDEDGEDITSLVLGEQTDVTKKGIIGQIELTAAEAEGLSAQGIISRTVGELEIDAAGLTMPQITAGLREWEKKAGRDPLSANTIRSAVKRMVDRAELFKKGERYSTVNPEWTGAWSPPVSDEIDPF